MNKPNLKLIKSNPVKPYQSTAKAARKHIKAAKGLIELNNTSDALKRLDKVDKALADMEEGA